MLLTFFSFGIGIVDSLVNGFNILFELGNLLSVSYACYRAINSYVFIVAYLFLKCLQLSLGCLDLICSRREAGLSRCGISTIVVDERRCSSLVRAVVTILVIGRGAL